MSGRETSGAIFLERAVVGLAGQGRYWKSYPLPLSPVRGLQKQDPSERLLYFLQVARGKRTGCSGGWAGGVAALEVSASQSLPGPRMEPASQDPDVGQLDHWASKEAPGSCLREPAAWVRRPHLRNLRGGPPEPGGGVQGTPEIEGFSAWRWELQGRASWVPRDVEKLRVIWVSAPEKQKLAPTLGGISSDRRCLITLSPPAPGEQTSFFGRRYREKKQISSCRGLSWGTEEILMLAKLILCVVLGAKSP